MNQPNAYRRYFPALQKVPSNLNCRRKNARHVGGGGALRGGIRHPTLWQAPGALEWIIKGRGERGVQQARRMGRRG